MRLENIAWMPQKGGARHSARNYDVRITLNKAGTGRQAIRFGFLNKGAEAFTSDKFIEVSDVEKMADRIYFRASAEKTSANAHALSSSRNSSTNNRYASLTPSRKAEKIYRMKWINGTYELKFDDECGLYYIENDQEAINEQNI